MLIKYQATLPTLTDKQAADFYVDVSGRLITAPQGNVAAGVADAGNPIAIGGVANSGVPASVSVGQRVKAWFSLAGALMVGGVQGAATDASSNTLVQLSDTAGSAGKLAVAGATFNGSTWDRSVKPNLTARLLSSAATTNATSVKASAGNIHKITGNNTVAVKKYLKLYNKASAPTVGTDTPVLTYVIPVSAAFSFDLSDLGTYFSTGIAYAITGAAADADATAIGAGDIECLNIIYS